VHVRRVRLVREERVIRCQRALLAPVHVRRVRLVREERAIRCQRALLAPVHVRRVLQVEVGHWDCGVRI
jgi:hypothetical protein